jgi:hypothetical protein
VEARPSEFKHCAAAYCSVAHSVEDWKRHKRQDGCTQVMHGGACDCRTCVPAAVGPFQSR